MPARDVPWVYDLRIVGMKRPQQDQVVRALIQNGIAARHALRANGPKSFAAVLPYSSLATRRASRKATIAPRMSIAKRRFHSRRGMRPI